VSLRHSGLLFYLSNDSRAMATVVGCSVACDRTQLLRFVKEKRFGIQTKGEFKWQAAEEFSVTHNYGEIEDNADPAVQVNEPAFSTVPTFQVRFSCRAHVKDGSDDSLRKHLIIAAPRETIPQNDILEGAQLVSFGRCPLTSKEKCRILRGGPSK